MSDHALELRYRRLMMAYPAAHRREYEDEMLAVLMTGTRPGQRRPSLGDAADLLRAGFAARLGQGLRAVRGEAWRDAAAVAGLLGAMVLAFAPLRRLAAGLGALRVYDQAFTAAQLAEVGARAALWLLVVGAALAGLRRSAAALGVTALAGEVVAIAIQVPGEEFRIVRMLWVLIFGALVAALLTLARRGRRATSVLSRRGLLLLLAPVGPLLVLAALVLADAAGTLAWLRWTRVLGLVAVQDLLLAVAAAVLLAAVCQAPGRVRDRVLVLLTAFVTVPLAQGCAEVATGTAFELDLTAGALLAAVALVVGLPVVTTGLALTGLWARDNLRVTARPHRNS
ncbi:hypothetical protein [Actinoplanes sp. RD1]|uniref:hypothetical protein n=1 Tax=Actinoplanes sp. RD1 TaxID=3064538 RepID=UPI0027415078|nr:hypothetical protein [Actinoplanes sp. RD1]